MQPQYKSNGAKIETFETMSQNKPFLLVGRLSQVFCYSDEKLNNTFLQAA
jgi:hypothetical protein